jgi:hypothetical protein
MRLATMVQIFFIIYCFEAGFLLLIAPWSPVWDRTVMQIAIPALRALFLHPVLRGGFTGFGLVHIVWGFHDLTALLRRRSPDAADHPDANTEI